MSSVEHTIISEGTLVEGPPRVGLAGKLLQLLKRKSAWFGFLATTFVLYAGWAGRHERNISAEDGLGYALGITGASMMAALLIYPLRKRIRLLQILGPTRYWFKTHMLLGIIGPVLILYHCNFSVSSLNSRVALFCTLLVAGSGVVGRYLYTQIHHGLYGEKLSLRSLVGGMEESLQHIAEAGPVTEEFLQKLDGLSHEVMEPPKDVLQSALRPFSVAIRTRWAYLQMSRKLRGALKSGADSSGTWSVADKKMASAIRRDVREHLRKVRKVAHLSFFDRLFSLWHILHLPFFFMLVISALVHILAVNLY